MKMQTTRGRGEKEGGKGGWRLFKGAVFMHVYSSCARKMPLLKYYLVLLEHTFAIEPFHMQSDKENRAVALSLLPLPPSFSFFLWCPFLFLLLPPLE